MYVLLMDCWPAYRMQSNHPEALVHQQWNARDPVFIHPVAPQLNTDTGICVCGCFSLIFPSSLTNSASLELNPVSPVRRSSLHLCSTDMNKHSARFVHVCLHPQSIQLLSAQPFPVPPYGPLEASCHPFHTLMHIPLRGGCRRSISFATLSGSNWLCHLLILNSCLHWYSIHPSCILHCPLLPTLKHFSKCSVLPERGSLRLYKKKKTVYGSQAEQSKLYVRIHKVVF